MKWFLGIIFIPLNPLFANNVVPNFQSGVLQQHTETKSTTTEDIKSFEFSTGYSLTVGGENVQSTTGNVAPTGWTEQLTTVEGVGTTYTSPNLDTKPEFTVIDINKPFNYYESLETGGLKNYTHIIRETTIESVSDSTSTFN